MQSHQTKIQPATAKNAFTLIEMLVVIAIMSILMTAGSIGLSGMGGKGVTSGVATAESLFDEARTIAVGKQTKARVLIAKDLTNNKAANLRRILVASEEPPDSGTWVLSSRGATLPDQTFYSQDYSKQEDGSPIKSEPLAGAKSSYAGSYYYYEFNSQGICSTPGASFVIGSGARKPNATAEVKPVVTGSAKRDFGGFVTWRNGGTSVFRSPDQMGIPSTIKEF